MTPAFMFANRSIAGNALSAQLRRYADRSDVVVLALPRGGVPVGYEVARELGVEFDVLIVRKLGVPGHSELAMGAIASGGAQYLNQDIIRQANVSQMALQKVLDAESVELKRREKLYRGQRPPVKIAGRIVIVVDDGMATGASLQAAVMALREKQPARIVVAVPVAPVDAADRFGSVVDEFVCVHSPLVFYSVGQFYAEFEQTSDEEVRALLAHPHPARTPA